ncbi:TrpB-like pyridoxal phosphate-dependent enzyme [Kitasatospora sp. NBC_00240]|uniref:TrpB-like pyridoxal phosphate-dependent enzyme n=1 Tax=Kitasatospora sp. NBC_00240 TaxID=2903567 RepID=UPI00224E2DF7|nr:TrpB-like pyridoxal phosphate-dependent enzyme [Kitasatospora sp. NBC_00240]MCX5210094.1 TrpB-like pyridoxal phosphate-dependent enzyme [Kitasatospora sp. NBC_00240]
MTTTTNKLTQHRYYLSEEELPKRWYNLAVDLPYDIEPHLHPKEDRVAEEADFDWLWPTECLKIELLKGHYATDSWIDVPEPVLAAYARFRPSPLVRARGLEEYLDTPHRIFYKREDLNPGGSHKFNTALAQAYYAAQDGVETLVTDTGAGQWGTALALACATFGLKLKVFMVRKSFDEKPYRRNLMRMLGAEVISSPSTMTSTGRGVLERDPNSPGSLGIGMAEAVELVRTDPTHRLALGCMSYYAALHQTVIGLETQAQLAQAGVSADVLVGCVGGGSNFTGFVAPFVTGDDVPLCIAAEPSSVPTLTKGEFRYDWADYERQTPRIPMYTLGSDFVPPPIHSGGLRYHGKTPILSSLVKNGLVTPRSFDQQDVFEAGRLFLRTEGVLPAPESSHAILAAIKEVRNTPAGDRPKNIAICLSGHGYLDLQGYADVLDLG